MKNNSPLEKKSKAGARDDDEEAPDFGPDDQFDFNTNFRENAYKCDVCSKIFAKKYNLNAHKRALHSPFPNKHVCDVCGKEFAFKSNYNTHKYTHMDMPRNFKCSVCPSAFKNARGLKNHLKTHDTDKNYVCEVCGKKFTTTINLKNHMSAHSELRPYYCEMCRSAFKRPSHLQQHQKEVHGVHQTKMARNFACDECSNSFTTRERLEVHKRKHTGELPFQCDKCWRGFASQMGLNVHHTMGECQSKTSSCKTCNLEFKPGEEPCVHVKLKRNKAPGDKASRSKKAKVLRKDKPRNFECELCSKTFIFNCDKRQHIRTCHTDERPFVCDECGKAFKAKNTLQNHQAVHSDSRPFPCTYCEKRFRRSEQLMLHTRTHTGEKPHICNLCGRGFAQIGDMKKHRKIHNRVTWKNTERPRALQDTLELQERQYKLSFEAKNRRAKCFLYKIQEGCEVVFYRLPQQGFCLLQVREKKRGDETSGNVCGIRSAKRKGLVCESCGKTFPDHRVLRKHGATTHADVERYECDFCGKTFKGKKQIRRHLRTHGVLDEPVIGTTFACDICEKTLLQEKYYEAHMRTHTGDLTHECGKCGKKFSSGIGLSIHRSHEGSCSECNRTFCSGETLCFHLKNKKSEEQKAKYVPRAFREKTKACPYCGKLFLFNSEVKLHVTVTHTEEKKFVCEECGKSFKTQKCFRLHKRIHSDFRPYLCRFCDKRFRTLSHIKQHIRTHTGEKPYCCSLCGRGFAQSGDVKKHLKKVHGYDKGET